MNPPEYPSPIELIRDNACRILGELLSGSIAGAKQPGDNVGPHRLGELLGESDSANVWRAVQTAG